MNQAQLCFRSQSWFQVKQLVTARISPQPFPDRNQPLLALRMEGARVVLKEKVVLDNACFAQGKNTSFQNR
jgi:hypothetical protein